MLFDGDGNRMTPSHAIKKGTRYRYYVSRSLITKDRTNDSAGLRIPAAEIEQLVSDRVHRWLLDPGSIYKSTTARLPDSSMQQRLVARNADLGKHWPELSVARKRAVLTALIERIEVSVDQIDIRLRPQPLNALLDVAATPSLGVNDNETEVLSADSEGIPFAVLAQREGVSRSYFTRLVRLSYLAPDITQTILDGRQPRDLTAENLLGHSRLPLAWHDQRIALGFA